MKKLLTLVAAALVATTVLAIPARPLRTTVTQSDGTTLAVTPRGDEHFHCFLTDDGLPVVRTADGNYCYAQALDGRLAATTMVAHEAALRTQAEQAFVRSSVATQADLQTIGSSMRAKRMAAGTAKAARQQQARALGAPRKVNSGTRRGLVILANFADVQMAEGNTQEFYNRQFNEEGFSDYRNTMSVHDYFKEQSYGQFDLTFDVVGPVTVKHDMEYYGAHDAYGNSDIRPGELIYEACKLVDDQVDFTTYDWDGDGEAELVFVVYAGYGEASSPSTLENTIWPHQWYLSSQNLNLRLDGVVIDNYACGSELDGDSGIRPDGIGTACHEFSHCFGLPDFYDTAGSNFGMSYWSILDIGCYLGGGYGPAAYTAYERWASGWMEPAELTEPATITGMKAIAESPEAYVIYNDANRDEFYVIENRQSVNADLYVQGHGLLVTHVDYDATSWDYNQVNTQASHQRCTIIAADNTYDTYTLSSDPFPGDAGKTELTNTSIPRATLYNANTDGTKLMSKPLTDIEESDEGLISFKFMGGKEETAIALPAAVEPTEQVSVYNAAGQLLSSSTYAQFLAQPLERGVYVVRTATGSYKVAK